MTQTAAVLPSFAEIFREHGPQVWRALRRLGVRPQDIEDACQEVFVVVHRRLHTFDGSAPLRAWVSGICVRTASDFRKRAHVRREELGETPEKAGGDAEDRHAAAQTLERVLASLDDEKQTVFVLYEIEQLTMKEIAQIVGCPLQTAYSRLHAARTIAAGTLASLNQETEK